MQLLPGDVIKLGDESLAYEQVRVEAAGADWVVIRTESGESRAATFAPYAPLIPHATILKVLKE